MRRGRFSVTPSNIKKGVLKLEINDVMKLSELVDSFQIPRESYTVRLKKYLCILVTLLSFNTVANEDIWTAFYEQESNKVGFKDTAGNVKIPPRFEGMTQATEFKNIIAVAEERDGKYEAYYLLKNGTEINDVRMFTNDNSFDCESDEKIRFRDKDSGSMGYLDKHGSVAVPAIYNTGDPFVNGLASVIKGAELFCHNGKAFTSDNICEHAHWKGGDKLVIDSNNSVIIKGVSLGHELDLYSVFNSETADNSEVTDSFKGVNGTYFNFVNVKKHFENWFRTKILSDLSKSNFQQLTFEEITLYSGNTGWYKQPKEIFWNNNYEKVKSALIPLIKGKTSFFVGLDSINKFIYKEEKYKPYYSSCFNQLANRHPIVSVISDHNHNGSAVQNIYDFIKLQDRYELLSITLRTTKIK